MASSRRRERFSLLPLRPIDETRAEFSTALSLRNACVAFHDDKYSYHRAHFVVDGPLESPIVMHGFDERASGYQRLTVVRRAEEYDRLSIGMCRREALGLGVPVSHASSIYHQQFHAVPSWLALRKLVADAGLGENAPAAAFVPLAFASAALGHGKPAQPRRWYAWEYSIRALTTAGADDIAAAASRLLRAPCTCFERFEADGRAFNPGARTSAPAIRWFRDAALRHAPLAADAAAAASAAAASVAAAGMAPGGGGGGGGGSGALLLFVSRQGVRRALSNEADVLALIARSQALRVESALSSTSSYATSSITTSSSSSLALSRAPRLMKVMLEKLPIVDQMRLVASATALIAVHGQVCEGH